MRNWIVLASMLTFGLGGSPAAAQTFGLGVHAGVSLPTSDYGDVAKTGFSGGLDLWYPLSTLAPGLSWYTSADAIAHSAEAESLDGGFLYIPLMTGLRFDIPVGPAALFVNGQAGAIFTRGPSSDIDNVFVDSETGTDFGFNFGGGLQLTDNVYAGVKYYPLGEVDFSYENGAVTVTDTRSVSFVDIYVGFGIR